MRFAQRLLLGAAATMFGAAAVAAEPAKTLVSLSGVEIELPWSKHWTQSQLPGHDPATVTFVTTSDASAMQALISPTRHVAESELTEEKLLAVLSRMTAPIAAGAVEKDLTPKALPGGVNKGWYVTATDKAPKPGEYLYVTLVLVVAGDIPVIATILFNEAGKKDEEQVRTALGDLKVTLPAQ